MDNIITFIDKNADKNTEKIKRTKMSLKQLVERVIEEQNTYVTVNDAEKVAKQVLEAAGYDEHEGAIPIVKIANDLKFRTIAVGSMPEDIEGNIFIGGATEDYYNTDKAIVVSKDEPYDKQRFIIAHELGHYFIDYLSSDKQAHPESLYEVAYGKNRESHDEHERMIDRFAAELLMPCEKFREQYNIAAQFSNNNNAYIVSYLSKVFKTEKKSIEIRIDEVGLTYN